MKSWKFDLGSSEIVESDFLRVTPEMGYLEKRGGGVLGLGPNGYKEDTKSDGFVTEKGQGIVLQPLLKTHPKTIDDYGVAVTESGMPFRFAVRVSRNTYYNVKVIVNSKNEKKMQSFICF